MMTIENIYSDISNLPEFIQSVISAFIIRQVSELRYLCITSGEINSIYIHCVLQSLIC